MNNFAWNLTVKWNIVIPKTFDFDYIESLSLNWDKNLYVFWETKINKSDELMAFFVDILWELKNYDISISSEDNIEIMPYDYEAWIYEVVSFEWEQINFKEIKNRFLEHDAIFSIRESEDSVRFWNKIIKVDFIY
jgi:hypothetical protein